MHPSPLVSHEPIHAVLETLKQGEALLSELGNEIYTRKIPVAFSATIGGHYRHCLDHFRSLLDAAESGDLNYDQRERGTLVETDCFAALAVTRELIDDYSALSEQCLSRALTVTCKTSYAMSGSQISHSTVGREVMYSVAHAVHHYALISVMCGLMEVPVPDGFGVAPSTLKHQREMPLAGS